MAQINSVVTTIPPRAESFNPLDTAIHAAGRKLCALQMTRLFGECTKSDAQSLTRDLLDIAKIIDDALLAIGHEARMHFGSDVDLTLFADQLLGALEGNATHTICAAADAREEEIADDLGYRRDRAA